MTIEPDHASCLRGFQIVHPLRSKQEVLDRFFGRDDREKQYVSFVALDWKNKAVRQISCAPGATANYFTTSDLPYETSPAFFRPEVLSKYKADTEKYKLEDRSISCRAAWHLQTYDINDAGQVHTYLVYLRNLPYEEQLYWKAHNEKPRGGLSKRAITTDFEGDFDLSYDALTSLVNALREWVRRDVSWWTLRSEELIGRVHYPATASPDEWANEILALHQLLVEGFEEKWLRERARTLGQSPDAKIRSLKLLEECLVALGYELDNARRITSPLHQLNELRSKLKGHAPGRQVTEIKRAAISEHGTYRKHFRELCRECDEAVRSIDDALETMA